jgi:hypothetical protein
MPSKMPGTGRNGEVIYEDAYEAERRQDAECTLTAIARAIVIGRLPPDDAFAWARIAACEVKALGG